MEAVSYAVETGSNMQLSDGGAVKLNVKIVQDEYNSYNAEITLANNNVIHWANMVAEHPSNKGYQAQLTASQTYAQNLQTREQTFTQQGNAAITASQNQAEQDSNNISRDEQLVQATNQIAQTLAGALGQSL
jgi:hypothetical protein